MLFIQSYLLYVEIVDRMLECNLLLAQKLI